MVRPASLLALALALLCSARARGAFLPPGAASAGGIFNMVLVYTDARSVPGSEWLLAPGDWASLLVQCEARLFDAVLLTGYMWSDGACFWPGQCKRPMALADWLAVLDLWAGDAGARALGNATVAAFGPGAATKVFVTIPYPDERAQRFGVVGGRALNFSEPADRVFGACWWVSQVAARLAPLPGVALGGFYWYLEGTTAPDLAILPQVAACVHAAGEGLKLAWIPSYEDGAAEGEAAQWRAAGFDFVTLQPNYAFYDVGPERFANASGVMAALGLGVEMELPLVVRNERIGCNATASFYAYLDSAAALGWYEPAGGAGGALKTYYNGNDFAVYARDAALNETLARRWDDIRAFVNGDYVPGQWRGARAKELGARGCKQRRQGGGEE